MNRWVDYLVGFDSALFVDSIRFVKKLVGLPSQEVLFEWLYFTLRNSSRFCESLIIKLHHCITDINYFST